MNLKTAIEILGNHQKWRLGEIDEMPYAPKNITEALDIVLAEVKSRKEEPESSNKPPL